MEKGRAMGTARANRTPADFENVVSITLFNRYRAYLASLPSPGGNGCHPALLGAANLGIIAGVTPEQIFSDLKAAIPAGKRPVANREIMDAVNRAVGDHEAGQPVCAPRPEPAVNDGAAILHKLIASGSGASEADLWEASPIRVDWPPEEDAVHILQALYSKDDLLFIGERQEPGIIGKTIRTRAEWVERLSQGGETAPYIIPNPLSGKPAEKKGGGMTLRGDLNVSDFRLCVAEFDALDRDSQLAFWSAVKLPIVALIDSAGKSIHGWLDVRKLADVPALADWDRHIRGRLYAEALIPLGVDSACSNPSRLSRLPGHFRAEKQRRQRILYLSPEGRRVF
jgi:hypothetical protein